MFNNDPTVLAMLKEMDKKYSMLNKEIAKLKAEYETLKQHEQYPDYTLLADYISLLNLLTGMDVPSQKAIIEKLKTIRWRYIYTTIYGWYKTGIFSESLLNTLDVDSYMRSIIDKYNIFSEKPLPYDIDYDWAGHDAKVIAETIQQLSKLRFGQVTTLAAQVTLYRELGRFQVTYNSSPGDIAASRNYNIIAYTLEAMGKAKSSEEIYKLLDTARVRFINTELTSWYGEINKRYDGQLSAVNGYMQTIHRAWLEAGQPAIKYKFELPVQKLRELAKQDLSYGHLLKA